MSKIVQNALKARIKPNFWHFFHCPTLIWMPYDYWYLKNYNALRLFETLRLFGTQEYVISCVFAHRGSIDWYKAHTLPPFTTWWCHFAGSKREKRRGQVYKSDQGATVWFKKYYTPQKRFTLCHQCFRPLISGVPESHFTLYF